jgi:hypothetical protein
MPFIIDGHNLIPHIPGIQLSDPDDESALIKMVSSFASQRRVKVELFFDQAPPSMAGSQSYGLVRVHHITKKSSADRAIKIRLSQLGKSAKNWTVVSSDREIIAEARSYQSQVISSQDFSKILTAEKPDHVPEIGEDELPEISPEDIQFWMDQFTKK